MKIHQERYLVSIAKEKQRAVHRHDLVVGGENIGCWVRLLYILEIGGKINILEIDNEARRRFVCRISG